MAARIHKHQQQQEFKEREREKKLAAECQKIWLLMQSLFYRMQSIEYLWEIGIIYVHVHVCCMDCCSNRFDFNACFFFLFFFN